MTPEDFFREQARILAEMQKAKKMSVKVGLPADKVGGEVYGDGVTIMQVGAQHEYGTENMPARSFLRMPFELKADEVDAFIQAEFKKVIEGRSTGAKALGRIGVLATNISKEAFRSNGFGQWAELSPITEAIKKKNNKTTPLIWSGLLRNSITWSVQE